MKARTTFAWHALGMAMLALLVTVAVAVGSLSPGPSGTVPEPERYRILDREGLQTQASVLNRAHSATLINDPQYRGPVMEIIFAKTPTLIYTELYDQYGFLLSKSTRTLTIDTLTDENGNIVANNTKKQPLPDKDRPSPPTLFLPTWPRRSARLAGAAHMTSSPLDKKKGRSL